MKHISYIKDFVTWKEDFSFYIDVRVRFSETDMFGHVNNVSAFIYFEEARIELFKHLNLFTNYNDANIRSVPVVADLQCDFHKQMYFGEHIKLYAKVNDVGNSSLDIHYLAMNEQNETCLTGRGRIVHIDRKTGKPTPLTEEMKDQLQQ